MKIFKDIYPLWTFQLIHCRDSQKSPQQSLSWSQKSPISYPSIYPQSSYLHKLTSSLRQSPNLVRPPPISCRTTFSHPHSKKQLVRHRASKMQEARKDGKGIRQVPPFPVTNISPQNPTHCLNSHRFPPSVLHTDPVSPDLLSATRRKKRQRRTFLWGAIGCMIYALVELGVAVVRRRRGLEWGCWACVMWEPWTPIRVLGRRRYSGAGGGIRGLGLGGWVGVRVAWLFVGAETRAVGVRVSLGILRLFSVEGSKFGREIHNEVSKVGEGDTILG